MNIRAKVLHQFKQIQYEPHLLLSKQVLIDVLNLLTMQNTQFQNFDIQIIDELWDNTPKSKQKYISVEHLSATVADAQRILRGQIHRLERQLKEDIDHKVRKSKLLQLYTVYNEYQQLAQPFKIVQIEESSELGNALQLIPQHLLNENNYIFSSEPNLETTGLKIVLWTALMSLGLQIIMMFHKEHFYNLLTICSVLCIFFMNYFDATYIKIVLFNLILSSILDMIWEIAKAKVPFPFMQNYWNQEGGSMTSSLQAHYLKFITIFVVLVAVGKLMMVAILFKYRKNSPSIKKNIDFMQLRFYLDGSSNNNPISLLFIQ